MVFTILASITYTAVGAGYATLIALAVFFEAPGFLTVATLRVVASVFLDLGLESMWVALHNRLHHLQPLRVTILVATVTTVALRSTSKTKGEAIAIKL